MKLIKAHAYGNDFLLLESRLSPLDANLAQLARRACNRHRGLGADGLILVDPTPGGARTTLFNSDGSPAEVSGNGIRTVAAWLARLSGLAAGTTLTIQTSAGPRVLTLIEVDGRQPTLRFQFRAQMGHPTELRQETFDLAGESIIAAVLNVGNPQCVVLGDLSDDRLRRIGGALAVHAAFPQGTNVELARVEHPGQVRILIWERGAGPTEASGTGACAAAVAAAVYGGASRDVEVVSPGGAQRVEWNADGLWLTGWADLVGEFDWWDSAGPI